MKNKTGPENEIICIHYKIFLKKSNGFHTVIRYFTCWMPMSIVDIQ